jgi:integrase
MKRDESMTWDGYTGSGRWKKQFRKKWYRVKNSELSEAFPELFYDDSREGSRVAANVWWISKEKAIREADSSTGLSAEKIALLVHLEMKNRVEHIGSAVLGSLIDSRISHLQNVVSKGKKILGLSMREHDGSEEHVGELLSVDDSSHEEDSPVVARAREHVLRDLIESLSVFDKVLPQQSLCGTSTTPSVDERSFYEVSQKFLDAMYLRTKESGGTKPLSPGRYSEIELSIRHLKGFVCGNPTIDDFSTAKTVASFHQNLISKVHSEEIASATARSRFIGIQQFLKWCYENEYIDRLPRNLSSLSVVVERKEPKVLDLEQFREIYNVSNDRVKLYLCLMSNCGIRNADVASLKLRQFNFETGHLRHSRIKTRHKNPPSVNYKLWSETLRLLDIHLKSEERKIGPDDLLFVNKDGLPIVRQRLENRKRVNTDTILQAFRRSMKKSEIDKKNLSPGMIRTTSASLIRIEYGLELQTLYLGNRPTGVSTLNYTETINDFRLDKPLEWLATQYQIGKKAND